MAARFMARHFAELRSASTPAVAIAAAGSFAGQVMAVAQAAPLWVYVLAAVAPWLPLVGLELIWTYRHYRWLAVFCVMVVSQSAYVLENVARLTQVRVLGYDPETATGIFGVLVNSDTLQLAWASLAVLGFVLLAARFRTNRFLVAGIAIAGWDALDALIGFVSPLGLASVDRHFIYSLLALVALNLAFALQLGRTYDAWLARAFPYLAENVLIETTGHLKELRVRPGQRVQHDGEQICVVTRGNGTLLREGPGGHEILLGILRPGQVVRERGMLVAETTLELLLVPRGPIEVSTYGGAVA